MAELLDYGKSDNLSFILTGEIPAGLHLFRGETG